MPDENENVDVYGRQVEVVGKSVFLTLEIDDLPNAQEVAKFLVARLRVGGSKISALDVVGAMFYIYIQNRVKKSN